MVTVFETSVTIESLEGVFAWPKPKPRITRKDGGVKPSLQEPSALRRHAENDGLVRSHFRGIFSIHPPQVFCGPEVANAGGKMFRIAKIGPVHGDFGL